MPKRPSCNDFKRIFNGPFQLTSRTVDAAQGGLAGANQPDPPGGTQSAGQVDRNPFEVASAGEVPAPLELDREDDQNLQGRKLDFLDQTVDADIYNLRALQDPVLLFQVVAGTDHLRQPSHRH